MRTKRVLITGGAGLIGSHIADELVKRDASEIVVLDNFTRGTRANLEWATSHGRVTIVEGDIRDRGLVADAMHGIDLVFHQAAIRITHCAEDPRLAVEVLADGTVNVLEAAVRANVKRVVAASSASIYGMADRFPIDESHHPYNNRTLYGAAKLFNEGLLRSFYEMHALDYVALRYFNVYGPRMDTHGAYTEVMIRWLEQIAEGRAPVIFGDGTQTMDFVHVRDVARANLRAAEARVTDEVFNIATGVETSLSTLAAMMLEVMDSPLQPECAPARRVNAVARRRADVRKAERLLGFRAEFALEDGLRDLLGWWRQERLGAPV